MVVFRNQDLTPDQQIKFNEYFGEVEVTWPRTTLFMTLLEQRYMSCCGSRPGFRGMSDDESRPHLGTYFRASAQ